MNKTVQEAINQQINMEMSSHYAYLSMSAYFEDLGLKGFAAWMYRHAQEENSLAQEQKVTESINKLVQLSRQEGDFATDSFLKWFVDEQVEEEEIVDDVIHKLRLISDFKPGLYLLDQELNSASSAPASPAPTAA